MILQGFADSDIRTDFICCYRTVWRVAQGRCALSTFTLRFISW